MIRLVTSAVIVWIAALGSGCMGPDCHSDCTQSFNLSARCGRTATCTIDGRGYLDNTGIGVAAGQTVRIEMAIERFSGELTVHFDRSLPTAPTVRVDGLTGGVNFSSGDRFAFRVASAAVKTDFTAKVIEIVMPNFTGSAVMRLDVSQNIECSC